MSRHTKQSRSYLVDGDAIPISPAIAVKFGINHAAFLQQLHYMLTSVRTADKIFNFEDDRWWFFYSYEQWKTRLPWLSAATIKRIAYDLIKAGVIITRQPPRNRWNRSSWYCINYEALHSAVEDALPSGQTDQMPSGQTDQIDQRKVTKSNGSKRPDEYITKKTTSKKKGSVANATPPADKPKRTKKDKPVDPDNTAIVELIDAWKKASRAIDPAAFGKPVYRDSAREMHRRGITPDDVTRFTVVKAQDAFWRGKSVPFTVIAKDIDAWKATQPTITSAHDNGKMADLMNLHAHDLALSEKKGA